MKPLVIKEIVVGKTRGNLEEIEMTDIEIRAPRWDPHPEKSKTQNWGWRQGLFPIFENGKYDWMPKFGDIDTMNRHLSNGVAFYIVFINEREPDKEYYWLPCEEEIKKLLAKKKEIDQINSDLAKRNL
jgi:hypothetical protein